MAQVTGQKSSHLLYVWDRNTGHKLLVDTGAQVSVFPASAQDRRQQKTAPLVAAKGSQIETFGTRTISLHLGSRRFKWPFVLANVNHPMLGADFFFSNHLLIDVCTQHIRTRAYLSGMIRHQLLVSTPAPYTSLRTSSKSHTPSVL